MGILLVVISLTRRWLGRESIGSQNGRVDLVEELSLQLPVGAPLSLTGLVINLVVGVILSVLLSKHFERFGTTLSNRGEFALVFPFIVLTTTLIITVVKTSLALSLGLVGALSIVRFRTPIKEPEELAYIFMAIAIGIGLGANQVVMTIVATLIILLLMAVVKLRHRTASQNLFLSITSEQPELEIDVQRLSDVIAGAVDSCELRRVDVQENTLQAVYYVAAKDVGEVYRLLDRLRADYPGAAISLIDQHRIPGV